ncbi:MAG: hypothetical protein OHK0031_01230 [Anaerolineales bacterium]
MPELSNEVPVLVPELSNEVPVLVPELSNEVPVRNLEFLMLKKINFRALVGGGMIVLGLLMLLEKAGILPFRAGELFWGAILLAGGAAFLGFFLQDARKNWWAILPAFALFGMSADALLPERLQAWSGAFFLGGLGLAFLGVYFTDRSRWWGIIPGGVLLTLALVSGLGENWRGVESSGVFFLGLGLTFFGVALLPNPIADTRWAYIPGAVLLTMGASLGYAHSSGLLTYFWPAALIVAGLGLIAGFFLRRQS